MDINIVNNSTPEKLREFADELNKYCQEVEASLSDLIKNHRKIGEHWSGEQYDQFTEKFCMIQKNISLKLQELIELRKFVLIKAQELEDAQKIRMDK